MRTLLLLLLCASLTAQCVQGVDLSYVNAVEAGGGIYRDTAGQIVDPFAYFAERGAEMVRLRLWHSPQNIEAHCGGGGIGSSNLDDVLLAARRADSAGMAINLALHYGDYFVDPGKQERPAAWDGLSQPLLLDSIYRYTYRVLERMHAQGTPPAILAVGNETDNGFVDAQAPTDGFEWDTDGPKFQAGIDAVADFNAATGSRVKSAIHMTQRYVAFGAAALRDAGVTNFDVFGVSYYPYFDPEETIEEIGALVKDLGDTYGKEVMIFETGFSWNNTGGGDGYNNFLGGNGQAVKYPASPAGQLDFLLDLTRTVCDNGGTGVFYWEPAWISSAMCDAWGQGSSYENASFFDFDRDNRALPAFTWLDFGTVAVEEAVPEAAVRVYANPALGDSLRVESRFSLTDWQLVGADGKVVRGGRDGDGDRELSVSTGELAAGVYFLRLRLADGRAVSRRVVVR